MIRNAAFSDDRQYTCKCLETNDSATIDVIANVHLKEMPNKVNAIRNDTVRIHCKTVGTNPLVSWIQGDGQPINTTRVSFEKDSNNVENAVLVIKNVDYDDARFYNCTAKNNATGFNQNKFHQFRDVKFGTNLEVRGKVWGTIVYYLWPY